MTKNQISNFLLYQRPHFVPAQYTRKKSDSVSREKCQRTATATEGNASEADKKQSEAKRTNHRAALKFEKCAVISCVLLGLLQFSLRSKPTNQVAAFERCWSTALLCGYHLSPSSVWIGRVPYSGQRTKFFFLNGPTYAGKIYVSIYFFLITTDRP